MRHIDAFCHFFPPRLFEQMSRTAQNALTCASDCATAASAKSPRSISPSSQLSNRGASMLSSVPCASTST